MKIIAILIVAAFVGANGDSCYSKLANKRTGGEECLSANGKNYKSFSDVHLFQLHSMINSHLEHSLKFTLMSSHFDKDIKNRNGFKNYFDALSDEHWNDALDLVDYVTLRGGHLSALDTLLKNSTWVQFPGLSAKNLKLNAETGEKYSLGHALDVTRDLSISSRHLIHESAAHGNEKEDSMLAHFLEEKYTGKYASRIRELSGYITVLETLDPEEEGVALDLFDQYL